MKTTIFVTAILAIAALAAAEGENKDSQFVRFEGGRDMEIASVREEGNWITFTLAGGGELSVPRERVQKTGDSAREGVFFVVGKMTQSRGPEAESAAPSAGPAPDAAAAARQNAAAPSCPLAQTPAQRAADVVAQQAEARRLASEVPEKPILFKITAPAKVAADEEFNLVVSVSDARVVSALGFRLLFNSRALELKAASDAGFYSGPLVTHAAPLGGDVSALIVQGSRMAGGEPGERAVMSVRFKAFQIGETALTLSAPYAHNGDGVSLPVGANDAARIEVAAR